MQRFMIHLLNGSYGPRDASALLTKARSLAQLDGTVVRDTRVSRKYLEFDVSIPDGTAVATVLKKLETISPVASYEHIVEHQMEKDKAIARAIEMFNDEKYWSAHEALEGVWKSAKGKERDTLNGIILVAAAFVHDEKDEPEICISILRRAMKKLDASSGAYHGIDLDRFAAKVVQIINSGKIERFAI
jgi:predicted metal-dependent hydrolase